MTEPSWPEPTNVKAWKEVHGILIQSIRREQDAISSLRAQRRYWLEELQANVKDGQLTASSVWRKPTVLKKKAAKRKPKQQKSRPNPKKTAQPRPSPETTPPVPQEQQEGPPVEQPYPWGHHPAGYGPPPMSYPQAAATSAAYSYPYYAQPPTFQQRTYGSIQDAEDEESDEDPF